MTDSHDYYVAVVFLKDHPPVADTQSGAGSAFQPLYITLSGGGEFGKASINPPSNIVRKLDPLARRRRREENLLHIANIANRDNKVKKKYRKLR